jgi:hypothetical protein
MGVLHPLDQTHLAQLLAVQAVMVLEELVVVPAVRHL